MSQLLLSELGALSSESKRKSPEVRTASDAALAALRTNGDTVLASTGQDAISIQDNILLRPITLACQGKTATPKVVGIAVGILQRIIGLRIVRDEDCPELIQILSHVIETRNDVEVHLKVLQAVSSLLSNYDSIHFDILAKTLRLCFTLQESRIGVVSSTASATLRQAVMTVYEKVKEEDRVLSAINSGGEDAAASAPLAAMTVPLPGTSDSVTLFPCSRDAYLIISDLNALANNDRGTFLGLQSLPRTFTLELIESILTNHAQLFRTENHPELLLCLRQSTCPLLIKAFNEQPHFPTTLRLMRLLFVLLRRFSDELIVEVEILMSILLRFVASSSSETNKRISSSSEATEHPSDHIPSWQRVLAIEATRSLCSDGILMRNLWRWFDGKPDSSHVFTQLVDTLHKLATEKPSLIGAADASLQMNESSSSSSKGRIANRRRRSSSGIYSTAAGVASAAIGLTSVTDLSSSSSVGLSQTSVPSVQLIDQLDKSEPPSVPSTYIYLVALQALVHLAQSLAAFALPIYSRFVNNRPRSAPRAPPSLDFSSLSDSDRTEMTIVRDMLQQSWAPLLDSFTFFLSCKCDDYIFAEVLTALRNFTNTTGALGLESPRDALIASLTRFAIPKAVITKLLSMRTRASANEDVDANLSERNAACLKAVTQIAYYLSGSLGVHWRDVLETLCDAEYVLRRSGGNRRQSSEIGQGTDSGIAKSPVDAYKPKPSMASISALSTIPAGFSSAAGIDATTGRPLALQAIDSTTLLSDIARVFENTTSLGDSALLPFIEALCELDADHVGLVGEEKEKHASPAPILNRSSPLSSLATVSMLNVRRLADSPDLKRAWEMITNHMLALTSSFSLRPSLRMQAANALDSFIQAAVDGPSEDAIIHVQQQSFEILAKQSVLHGRRKLPVDIDVRRTGLETIHTILEARGHTLQTGWETIFSIFTATCQPTKSDEDRSSIPLIKVAFNALNIICSNHLSKLNQDQLKLCVEALTRFSEQEEDVNISLTAGGALWGITAEVSSRANGKEDESEVNDMTDMWIHVLSNVRRLTDDARLQVRNGAISILFNILEQYGRVLSEEVWEIHVMGQTLLTLLEGLHSSSQAASEPATKKDWCESQVLAFNSTGKIVRQVFVDKLLSADTVWERLLINVKNSFLSGPSTVSQSAIRALHHILQVNISPKDQGEIKTIMRLAWEVWCEVGEKLGNPHTTFTQANLLAYVEAVTPLYALLKDELTSDQIYVMLSSLKAALTYDQGKERISDGEKMTALQFSVTKHISNLQLSPTITSRVLMDLAEYSTLAFISSSSVGATYLALNRYSTEAIVDLFAKWSEENEVYTSGAIQQVFASFTIPLKLRYECPSKARSSPDDEMALWKSSSIALCKLTTLYCACIDQVKVEKEGVIKGVWTSMISAFVAALKSDCSPIMDLPIDKQDSEETFDLILLSTIEREIWPHLGKSFVPDECIINLAAALRLTSELRGVERSKAVTGSPMMPSRSPSSRRVSLRNPVIVEEDQGNVMKEAGFVNSEWVPREAFAYWCFDLLILLSSSERTSESSEEKRNFRRVTALCLPSLVERIQIALKGYIDGIGLLGAAPLSRVRDEEINYILFRLSTIQLGEGSLQIALSPQPKISKDQMESYLNNQTIDLEQKGDFKKDTLRSPDALLFHLYPLLCQFLFTVVPRQGGRRNAMIKAICGCARLYEPVQTLPRGFELEKVGQFHFDEEARISQIVASSDVEEGEEEQQGVEKAKVTRIPILIDARELAYNLLQKIGSVWIA